MVDIAIVKRPRRGPSVAQKINVRHEPRTAIYSFLS